MRKSSMSQRLLSFVLAFAMVFSMVPVQAFAAEDVDHVHIQETTETTVSTEETTVPTTEAVLEAAETEEPTQITTEAPTEATVVTEPAVETTEAAVETTEAVAETTETTEATEEATEAPTEETVPAETEEVVEEFLSASAEAANASSTAYVTGIYFAVANNWLDAYNAVSKAGYKVIDYDLNKDAGGKYIYMGYQTSYSPENAITGIFFSDDVKSPPSSYTFPYNGYNITATKAPMWT